MKKDTEVEVLNENGRVFFTGKIAPHPAPWVGWNRVIADGPIDLPPRYTVRKLTRPPSPGTVLLRDIEAIVEDGWKEAGAHWENMGPGTCRAVERLIREAYASGQQNKENTS